MNHMARDFVLCTWFKIKFVPYIFHLYKLRKVHSTSRGLQPVWVLRRKPLNEITGIRGLKVNHAVKVKTILTVVLAYGFTDFMLGFVLFFNKKF